RPFLRSREILWQEGHTMHATKEEAREETLKMLHVYEDFQRNVLALPVIVGRKTEKEKFAGAEETYTLEAMMYDGVALQNGTSHFFGDHFAKAFKIQFLDENNELKTPYQTSWGVTTRMIGAIIMTHGDNHGLVLPPNIAPTKVVFIPIGTDEKVLNKVRELQKELPDSITSIIDDSKKSPGFKFADAEVKGIPIRVELGSRDLENDSVTLVRRDTLEKITVSLENAVSEIEKLLPVIQQDMYDRALKRRDSMIYEAGTYEELKESSKEKNGFYKINWCGDTSCENQIKEETGLKSRCIIENEEARGNCIVCGKKATTRLYVGKQY
ncbi:MAG: proline--tRNA ligase, partial [Bacilli bacterium]|nr:proline--tRNA ligase [Bacilli bacterium]